MSHSLIVLPDDTAKPILDALRAATRSLNIRMFLFTDPTLLGAILRAGYGESFDRRWPGFAGAVQRHVVTGTAFDATQGQPVFLNHGPNRSKTAPVSRVPEPSLYIWIQ